MALLDKDGSTRCDFEAQRKRRGDSCVPAVVGRLNVGLGAVMYLVLVACRLVISKFRNHQLKLGTVSMRSSKKYA